MTKNLKVNMDPESFRDSLRPNMPPGLNSQEASTNENNETDTKEGVATEKEPVTESAVQEPRKKAKGATKPKAVNDMPQGTVDEFMEYFVKRMEIPVRSQKTAYIRPAYHDRIMRILNVVHKRKLSLSGYVDHVLTHHFLYFEDAIRTVYAREQELSGDIYSNGTEY